MKTIMTSYEFEKKARKLFKEEGLTTLDGVNDFMEVIGIVRNEWSLADNLARSLESLLSEWEANER